jgi:hypothetical protein
VTQKAVRHPAQGKPEGVANPRAFVKPITELDWKRAESGTRFSVGDRLRLAVEVPRTGYLYVVDREKYRDGGLGDPFLIFPTSRTNGGDNRVSPGWLVEIPSREDNPPYFILMTESNPSGSQQPAGVMPTSRGGVIGDVLTFIVAPGPILEVGSLDSKPLRLAPDQVSLWEKKWGGSSERYEMTGGAGNGSTEEEKSAGAKNGTPLTENAPLPQTIYRVSTKPGEPIVISVPLVVAKVPVPGETPSGSPNR